MDNKYLTLLRPRGAAVWLPTDIGGCKRWGRSDLGITKDGSDRVSIYADQSGNGNDFTQTMDDNKFVWYADQIDGYPGLYMDGNNDFMVGTGSSLVSVFNGNDIPFSIFFVAKQSSMVLAYYTLWSTAFLNNLRPFNKWTAYNGSYYYEMQRATAAEAPTITGGIPDLDWHYFLYVFKGTTADFYKDGVKIINNGSLDTIAFSDIDTFTLGCFNYSVSQSQFFLGYIAEDAIYDNEISSDDITLLHNYAATRYPSI